MHEHQRYLQARNITLIGAVANLLFGVIKILFGWIGHSQALIADGIHSISDLLTDALVLLASKFGSRKADSDHPYGHQRIETAATLFLAMLLIIAGLMIAWNSVSHLIFKFVEQPHAYVLIIAFISIIINELLYRFTLHYGEKINSRLLIANAWHHRSDALSSIVVLVGVLGAVLGYVYLDAIAAIIVGLMIIKMGVSLGWSSVRELVDTGVPETTLNEIHNIFLSVPGVKALHQLRTRCMADNILVDAHILVDPRLSVSEGHYIATKAHEVIRRNFPKVNDVTIHVDPENDEMIPLNLNLPPRQQILAELIAHWLGCPGVDYIHNVKLHYLEGKIEVEAALPLFLLEEGLDAKSIQAHYQASIEPLDYIREVIIIFS